MPTSWAIGTFHQNNPIFNKRTVVMDERGQAAHRGTSYRQTRPVTADCDKIGSYGSSTKARIDPESRVANEDYFRAIKEN